MRAYRQRKAEEHASADEAARRTTDTERKLSDATGGRARAEAALERETKRAERLQHDVARLRARVRTVEADLGWARSKCTELLERYEPSALVTTPGPGLSRQQRRAMERNKRKRGR